MKYVRSGKSWDSQTTWYTVSRSRDLVSECAARELAHVTDLKQ